VNTDPPGPDDGGGGVTWGDVHAVAFDGSHWDHNESRGGAYWMAYVHDRFEYSNIKLSPWRSNPRTTVQTGFALLTNYGGRTHRILFNMGSRATLDGSPLPLSSRVKDVDGSRKVYYLYNGQVLRVITPGNEYAVTYLSGGYGNVAALPRMAPHLDGVFQTGLLGDSFHFMGYAAGDTGRVSTSTTTTPWNTATRRGSHRASAGNKQIGYVVGSNPFGLPSITGYGKTRVLRIDGFFPCDCALVRR
jgi:hypothetical protein